MNISLSTSSYLDKIVDKNKNAVLQYMTKTLMEDYNPDINGYTLLFVIPPDLSESSIPQTQVDMFRKFVTFASVDFKTPQIEVSSDQVTSRNGAVPHATEVSNTQQLTVTYIENADLDIYGFHESWIKYMWELLEGQIRPPQKYLEDPEAGTLFYTAAFYGVKYLPDLQTITHINKSIGAFPQSLPTNELLGQRTSNELTTLPFQYFCSAFRSETTPGWILEEFETSVLPKFQS